MVLTSKDLQSQLASALTGVGPIGRDDICHVLFTGSLFDRNAEMYWRLTAVNVD
ncbi:hypothetical protein K439DRAFT_1639342 [Ramaria rubella]|nr:hypothetical protein K439DRAFT_1639342 [Ramaria rubella]